jgi:hypothetical protein
MRKLETHKVDPTNERIDIEVRDTLGAGGAHCHYNVSGFDTKRNPARIGVYGYKNSFSHLPIVFQSVPVAEVGVNGITHEVLIAIIIDRLEHFQKGQFANDYNRLALEHLDAAHAALRARALNKAQK